MVFKRATVEVPERVLHLNPGTTGVNEAGRLTLERFTKVLEQIPT